MQRTQRVGNWCLRSTCCSSTNLPPWIRFQNPSYPKVRWHDVLSSWGSFTTGDSTTTVALRKAVVSFPSSRMMPILQQWQMHDYWLMWLQKHISDVGTVYERQKGESNNAHADLILLTGQTWLKKRLPFPKALGWWFAGCGGQSEPLALPWVCSDWSRVKAAASEAPSASAAEAALMEVTKPMLTSTLAFFCSALYCACGCSNDMSCMVKPRLVPTIPNCRSDSKPGWGAGGKYPTAGFASPLLPGSLLKYQNQRTIQLTDGT